MVSLCFQLHLVTPLVENILQGCTLYYFCKYNWILNKIRVPVPLHPKNQEINVYKFHFITLINEELKKETFDYSLELTE